MAEIKETKEVLMALLKILPIIVADFKDGVQVSDALDIYTKVTANEELKTALSEAFAGYQQIPDEVKAATPLDYVKLLGEVLPELIKTIEALKA